MDETVCKYFNSKAGCRNGEKCEFKHTELDPSAIKLCKHFTGEPNSCLFGDKCRFRHESPDPTILYAGQTLQTDCNTHEHSSQVNSAEEENDSHNEDDSHQGFFECEYCNFKIEISNPDEDEVALYEKHFREKHIDLLQGSEYILKYLGTDSTSFDEEYPDLETAANVKGKKVENKQNAKTSSSNKNKNLVNVRYPGGEMNLEHHRFPDFFSDERKKLLDVIVSSYVSSFSSQKEQIACIMKELALTEEDYSESLGTVTKYMMNVGEDLQECATRLQKMFKFHKNLLVNGPNVASDLEMFFSKIFEKENIILYSEYISTLLDYKKKLQDLRNDNKEFDEKCKEFESNERCMLRLQTLLSMPEKRFKYYFNICMRIEEICGQQDCGKMNGKSHEIKLLGDAISGCIKDVMMHTDFELKYTEYRWKGRQLRMLRHKYFQEAIRAAVKKMTTSEAIQKAQLGRELGPKIKDANIWGAEQMLLSRCQLLQKNRQLDLHYLFQDEARDSLEILLPSITNEIKSERPLQAVPLDLTIVTGKGKHSKDKQPILITSVQNSLRRQGYPFSEEHLGAYLIYFKI
ncbi:uncharacterized protein LOC127724676 isoform X2 [Mytilus californianus]|uniref:uncharacterized protein LOC127724676 isoform X2 n=1 Tax=Mytilus californianus TaxID=6549 RepID=UPI002245FBEB|nr:uncharacterized protein LOC127724676 isoform X2 [Mytilus californianus]